MPNEGIVDASMATIRLELVKAVEQATLAERKKWQATFDDHVYVPDNEYAALCDAVRAAGLNVNVVLERMRRAERERIQKWRNDALEAAAHIADRYGQGDVATDIRAMIEV